ncbi:MAG: cytidine deaminase [Aurantibacter sp.]
MKKHKNEFEYFVYDNFEELSEADKILMKSAIAARNDAYAPYSNFQVGVAVLLENGETVIGNNQENASYPAGVCAERVAILHAGAKYPGIMIKAIAISATSTSYQVNRPVSSCGICRQTMAEFEQKQKAPIEILMSGEIGPVIKCNSVLDLIPFAFDGSFLK